MNLPSIGELNRRVTLFTQTHTPDANMGFQPEVQEMMTVWGKLEVVGSGIYWGSKQIDEAVTHRIWVRRIRGATEPKLLRAVTEAVVDGMRYRVKRVEDANGAHRFTVMDCEELREEF